MTTQPTIVRGAILQPKLDGSVRFIRDGILASDSRGIIDFIGDFATFPGRDRNDIRAADCIICPPFFDNHIHISQHPIRGHFMDGIDGDPPGGRLIAGLERNVFPTEGRCADPDYTRDCIAQFRRDALAHGVVGGAAYMTVHTPAARAVLEALPETWSAGLVMMNQNCPEYLRINDETFDRDAESLARDFGRRYIVTDRFAVACDQILRRRGAAMAKRFHLRMQTHLNEQLKEKLLVETELYNLPYTEVYERDGLLDLPGTIMAHCVHMTNAEFAILSRRESVIAHCPVSNTLLGSGIMPLDRTIERGIDYAICTDVGASPTTSLLNEMAQFLKVHAGRSKRATPCEALFRTTLGASKMLGYHERFGQLEIGRPMSFVEIRVDQTVLANCQSSDEVIAQAVLEMPARSDDSIREAMDALQTGQADASAIELLANDVTNTIARLDGKVARVTLDGKSAGAE